MMTEAPAAVVPIAPSGKIQSVTRAMRLLMLVASGSTDATGKELASAAGLPVPTAYHLLNTLVHAGLLAKDSKARYLLGVKVAVLADSIQRAVTAPEYLLEPLRRLAQTTGETSYVAAWRQGDIRILASVDGHGPVRVSLPLGPYTDAHSRATGKLLLALATEELRGAYLAAHPLRQVTERTIVDPVRLQAEFEQIRVHGYAVDEQEFQQGVCCAAAPVVDEGVVVATYSISVPAERFGEGRLRFVDSVLAVASTLTLPPVRGPASVQGVEGGR
jgi:DNA-binding IclR family transcriptional regulator